MVFTGPERTVEIFDERPTTARAEIFDKGIPLIGNMNEMGALILYTPRLQSIGSMDNTDSDASTTYTREVSTGFATSSSVSLALETAMEVSAEFVKASFKMTSTITFTEQWSTVSTEKMEFSVPAGKKAFTYQGFLFMEKMFYSAKDRTYRWSGDGGRCLTSVMATTRQPLPPERT
jgi:hypothetical protein